ncbi:B-cell linker protein isoform X1 [Synchiropus splendidus]|uniref:B-cell linker protein isoform X1 n=1 Tax=Synchiropus splendidus TaxID=270530 RepID=UPI00237E883D|nr:B-cell linker protein isoform X1 [Synchiropus splendidus]
MSFFGKLKNRAPHTLPRRTDVNCGRGWPADEFDNDDGDTYEPPPCEPPPIPPRHVKENIYMDDLLAPAPPPWPIKPLKSKKQSEMDEISITAPAISRSDKPRGVRVTSSPAVSSPASPPNSIADEDVYMDPDKQAEDELYLEPVDPSPVCQGVKVMPPDYSQSSAPRLKPPVPRAQSNSSLPSFNVAKPANFDVGRNTFPLVLPPAPSFKPPLPQNLKPLGSVKRNKDDSKGEASSDSSVQIKLPDNEVKEWFAGNCSRKQAEEHLLGVNMDGAFLIRKSSNQCGQQPFTLVVLLQQKVFNIPIRLLEETQSYVLGKEGKKIEEKFSNLQELILYHQKNHLHLIDSNSQAKHTTFLTQPTRP